MTVLGHAGVNLDLYALIKLRTQNLIPAQFAPRKRNRQTKSGIRLTNSSATAYE